MARNAGTYHSADNLLQVAGFLKQADKLVRERNYPLALEQIAKARAKDPTNSYAEAYEQRVQLLLGALNEKRQARTGPNGLDSDTPHSFSQHLERIADLAIQEAQRTANISLQQQTLDMQQCNSKLNPLSTSLDASKNEKETLESKEERIRRYVHSAEELFRDRRVDEALNMLAPAILLDPLNEAILELEHQIRDSQEEDCVARLRQYQEEDEPTKRAREENNAEIQKCILRATHLADRKEFSEALMVLGQGYLLDPFSAPLAKCEKVILAEIGKETSLVERQPGTRGQVTLEGEPRHSEARQRIFQYLDKAQDYLGEDLFAESLSQVALAMIAAQNEKKSEENKQRVPARTDKANREFADPGNGLRSANQGPDDVSQQIFDLVDKAKRLASKEEFDSALEVLLQASYLIPSDGSLDKLDREIARKFMEYYQLVRPGRIMRMTQDRSQYVLEPAVALGDRKLVQDRKSSIDSRSGIVCGKQYSSRRVGSQLEFEDPLTNTLEDRISQIREHLLRSLRHLNNMKLIEASVEGELAALVDNSRKDTGSFALAVAGLARKAKTQIPLNVLSDAYDTIRQQAKDLIHGLWYEEILHGINRGLEILPTSDILLTRREEVEQIFKECKRSTTDLGDVNGLALESSKRFPPASRKVRKSSFDQMGLGFSGDLEPSEKTDELRSDEDSDATEGLPVQKPMRRGSTASSGSAYLGN